jgi:7,8-dihydropterin-6-yl-methyl-4-(beta-D-ribofuranosyl)aminobenzene 5'-phosphate synthase
MRTLRITILCDNQTIRGDLRHEDGLAIWIETPDRRILFDTGLGTTLEPNAKTLGIDLSQADTIVLSHGHYDHSSGLPIAMNRAPSAPVFFHPKAIIPRFNLQPDGSLTSIGMTEAVRGRLQSSAQSRTCLTQTEVAAGVWVAGAIARRNGFEDTDDCYFLDPQRAAPDPVEDELVLWIETRRGIILLTGCCHVGIVNTIEHVQRLSGKPINAIIGGLHLQHATKQQLEAVITSLNKQPHLEQIVLCHCTGEEVTGRMRKECRAKVIRSYAGLVVGWESPKPDAGQ